LKRIFEPIQFIVLFALAAAVVVAAGRCAEYALDWKAELGGKDTARLDDSTVEYLRGLDDRVYLTYVVTNRRGMPSRLKRVEARVVEVLEAMRKAAPEKVGYEVLDPSSSEEIVELAAQKKVAQTHVESIAGDRETEKVVWSSIVVSRGTYRDVVIHGVTEEHVPYLEDLIVGHLENMANPVRPTIAVSAPDGFNTVSRLLSDQGEVIRIDFANDPEIPPSVDMLYLFEPGEMSRRHVFELKRFLETGRNVVVADSIYGITPVRATKEGDVVFEVKKKDSGAADILKAFGLSFRDYALMDERCESFRVPGGGQVSVPLAIKAIQPSFNLKNFAGTMSGNLSFYAASAIDFDQQVISAQGYDVQTVVTTSEKVWTLPLENMMLSTAEMSPTVYRPKQPVAVMVSRRDPFYGRILVFGADSIFRDGDIEKPGFAHRVFLKLLGRTFLSNQELVKMRVDRELPPPAPDVPPSTVVLWRVLTIFLLPALALAALLMKVLEWPSARKIKIDLRYVVVAPAAVIAVMLLLKPAGALFSGFRMDFTENKVNSLSGYTIDTISGIESTVKISLYSSDRSDMPAAMKLASSEVEELLGELARIGRGKIVIEKIDPGGLTDSDKEKLAEKGVVPREVQATEYDAPVTKVVWNSLVLDSGGEEFIVPFISERNIDRLEFLAVSALKSIQRGRPYHIAVASDMPRLSPAEAFEDYFKKQLTAPVGSDVYSEAKELLAQSNFRVSHVDPKEAMVPAGTDLLVWLQPRRPVDEMAVALGRRLAAGGNALVAMQHYNIQQRQYSGRGFRTVYWPQPQYVDINHYLDIIGVDLRKEVLMDEERSNLELEMQINRMAVREYEDQEVAKPFLIRAVPPNFSRSSPITANLGDLLFIWGNRFVVDREKLASLGLVAETLISTSERVWNYDWSGGFLSPEVLGEKGKPRYLDGPQPLAILVKGTFPPVHLEVPETDEENGQEPGPVHRDPEMMIDPGAPAPAGVAELLLVGCSEMFKNHHLREPGFYHDRFLLNSVTYLTMGPDAVKLLAKKNIAKGFERPREDFVMRARALVIGIPVIAILVFGLAWSASRRRRRTRITK